MTAKQLIDYLQELPSDAHICVRGYEGGVDNAKVLKKTKILHNRNEEWYYGQHEETDGKHFDEIVWVIQ